MTGERRRSRLRLVDVARESWLEVTRRPGRAIMAGFGIALGSGAIVATMALVATIRFQVSDEFDVRRATQIEVRASTPDPLGGFPPSMVTIDRIEGLSGVEGVAVVRETVEPLRLALNQVIDRTAPPTSARVYGIDSSGLRALDVAISGRGWDRWHDSRAERVVLVSRQTALDLGASGVTVGDRLFISGIAFTVVGSLDESPRLPALADGLVVPSRTAEMFALDQDRDRIVVITAPGAAAQVALALPVALSPDAPESWAAYTPIDDEGLRRAVDSQFQALSLGLGGVVVLLGIVAIGNSVLTSVLQRIHEIGLRRALGARPRHIAVHILFDAAMLGAIGGIVGATLGLTAVLAVTAYQGWSPVVDPRLAVATIAGGLLAGTLAGLYPARLGSRIQPTEALRRS